MPYGITRCYLPPGRADIPTVTPAEAGTRFSDPGDTGTNVAGERPGTSFLLGVTRWETVKGRSRIGIFRTSSMGVPSVLMVQGRAGDLGEPVRSRGGAPVGGLRDEVTQNLKHNFTEF